MADHFTFRAPTASPGTTTSTLSTTLFYQYSATTTRTFGGGTGIYSRNHDFVYIAPGMRSTGLSSPPHVVTVSPGHHGHGHASSWGPVRRPPDLTTLSEEVRMHNVYSAPTCGEEEDRTAEPRIIEVHPPSTSVAGRGYDERPLYDRPSSPPRVSVPTSRPVDGPREIPSERGRSQMRRSQDHDIRYHYYPAARAEEEEEDDCPTSPESQSRSPSPPVIYSVPTGRRRRDSSPPTKRTPVRRPRRPDSGYASHSSRVPIVEVEVDDFDTNHRKSSATENDQRSSRWRRDSREESRIRRDKLSSSESRPRPRPRESDPVEHDVHVHVPRPATRGGRPHNHVHHQDVDRTTAGRSYRAAAASSTSYNTAAQRRYVSSAHAGDQMNRTTTATTTTTTSGRSQPSRETTRTYHNNNNNNLNPQREQRQRERQREPVEHSSGGRSHHRPPPLGHGDRDRRSSYTTSSLNGPSLWPRRYDTR